MSVGDHTPLHIHKGKDQCWLHGPSRQLTATESTQAATVQWRVAKLSEFAAISVGYVNACNPSALELFETLRSVLNWIFYVYWLILGLCLLGATATRVQHVVEPLLL